jgi:hypothetical protein
LGRRRGSETSPEVQVAVRAGDDLFDHRVAHEPRQPRRRHRSGLLALGGRKVYDDARTVDLRLALAGDLEGDPGDQAEGVRVPLTAGAPVRDHHTAFGFEHRRRRGVVIEGRFECGAVRGVELAAEDEHPRRVDRDRELAPFGGPRVEGVGTVRVQPRDQMLGRQVGLGRRQAGRGLGEPGVDLGHAGAFVIVVPFQQVSRDLAQGADGDVHVLP